MTIHTHEHTLSILSSKLVFRVVFIFLVVLIFFQVSSHNHSNLKLKLFFFSKSSLGLYFHSCITLYKLLHIVYQLFFIRFCCVWFLFLFCFDKPYAMCIYLCAYLCVCVYVWVLHTFWQKLKPTFQLFVNVIFVLIRNFFFVLLLLFLQNSN